MRVFVRDVDSLTIDVRLAVLEAEHGVFRGTIRELVLDDHLAHLLDELPPAKRHGLRTARLLVIRPSRDLARLAAEYEANLPRMLRYLTRGLGTQESRSPDFLAMLLFDGAYAEALIQLGEEDAEMRSKDLDAFLAA